jgi:hypothetical protein
MLQLHRQQSDHLNQVTAQQGLLRHWQATQAWFLAGLTEAQQRHLAQQGLGAAAQQGITAERDVLTWCDLCIAAGTDFAAERVAQRRRHG